MAALGAQSIASSYEQLLHVDRDGGGNSTTHVSVKDGDNGTTFGFTIATDALMMSSTNRLEFGDTGTYIHQSADGVLDLVSDTEIEINATTIDVNGALDLSGNAQLSGTVTVGADGSGTDVIFYSGTAGDNFTWDASAEKLTITGTNGATALDVADGNLVVADNVDIEGDIDVNGTTNLDAVDIDGAVQADSTITVGADDQGYDVKFFGDTASAYMLWDTSEDDLVLAGAAGLDIAGDIDVDGTANLDAVDIDGAVQLDGTFTVGTDGSGQDVVFYSGTSGDNFTWDSSEECLTITGTDGAQALKVADGDLVVVDKIYLSDNDGGEYLSGDGTTLTITAGAASAVKLDANSRISLSNNDSGTSNTIFGKSAGASLDAGSNYNVFIGENVSDATMNVATCNTAVGYNSLSALTTGDRNVCLGEQTGAVIAGGEQNVLIGTHAGQNFDAENDNTFVGYNAGSGAINGADNCVAIGSGALADAATVDGTTAIGFGSLGALTSGASNTAVGYQAGNALTTTSENTFVGHGTGTAITGTGNTAMGVSALGDGSMQSAVNYCVAIGRGALTTADSSNDSGQVAVGYKALQDADAASGTAGNVAVGYEALKVCSTGGNNVAIGFQAMAEETTGSNNTVVGHTAMDDSLAGLENNNNTFIGFSSGGGTWLTSSSDSNTAVGSNTMIGAMNDANYNTAMGHNAQSGLTVGVNNTGIGYAALTANLSGGYNTAVGATALDACTGGENTAMGWDAGGAIIGGTNNACFGSNSGDVITSGSQNTIIGSDSDPSAVGGANQTVVGYGATGIGDNYAVIGNASTTRLYAAQDGAGVLYANGTIQSSDRRLKENIDDSDLGLEFINKIRPVSYTYINDKQDGKTKYGIIAQEVQEVLKEINNQDFAGIKDEDEYLGADYNQFVAPLIKAIQELTAKVETLENA